MMRNHSCPQSAGDYSSSRWHTALNAGRGSGVAVLGGFTADATGTVLVSANRQSANVAPPARLGEHLDPLVGGTFSQNATVVGNVLL